MCVCVICCVGAATTKVEHAGSSDVGFNFPWVATNSLDEFFSFTLSIYYSYSFHVHIVKTIRSGYSICLLEALTFYS